MANDLLVVTGLPRSGTSWTGKMLEASGQLVYVNEPTNPRHPPGGSPGVLDVEVAHRYHYVTPEQSDRWTHAFESLAQLNFGVRREMAVNRTPKDLARMGRSVVMFASGKLRGMRAMVDDPYLLFSIPWLVRSVPARVVVVVRDPVTYVGSRRRVGWSTSFDGLLAQPELMDDLLHPWRDTLHRAVNDPDEVRKAAVLWQVAHDIIDVHLRPLPGVRIVRYEDLASSPIEAYTAVYEGVGLDMGDDAIQRITAATSASQDSGQEFRWSWRDFSRTAFRPMDSAASLSVAQQRLTEAETTEVREITADVAQRFPREFPHPPGDQR